MIDEYGISRYIPQKYQIDIESIEMELDFDNGKNRTVHHYFVNFSNGDRLSAIGIKDIVAKIKKRAKTKGD